MIDIVIVTNSSTKKARELTKQTISTAIKDGLKDEFFVIVVETSGRKHEYKGANHYIVIHPEDFGYNYCLNLGAKAGKGSLIVFCNNDLQFSRMWSLKLINAMAKNKARSASGYCPLSHKPDYGIEANTGVLTGTQTRKLFAGWCFAWRRDLYDEVVDRFGGHDEDLRFWCCDNATTEQLNKMGEKHILCTGVEIKHVNGGSSTLNSIDETLKNTLTRGQIKVFNRKYNKNLFNLGK